MTDSPNNDRHSDKANRSVRCDAPANKHTDNELSDLIHQVANDTMHQRDQEIEKYWSTHKLAPADLPTLTIGTKDNVEGNIYDRLRMPSPNGLPDQHCIYPPKHSTSNSRELPAIPFLAAGALAGAAGSWAAPASADLSLLAKQKQFLGSIPNTQIGTAEELNAGDRLFSQGIDLSKYGDLMARNRDLLPKESLSFPRGPLGPLLERGTGSWLGRTLGGSARGLAVAAGIMAIGYAWEQVGNMMAHKEK